MMEFFEYGQQELDFLSNADPAIGEMIKKYGIVKREIEPDPYKAIIDSIVSQQISGKAAQTVFQRLCDTVGKLEPIIVLNTSDDLLRSCGLSGRKVSYIKSASDFFANNYAEISQLSTASDEEVIRILTQIKGVGIWTAEMMLIFSFRKKNILSYNDLGIRKGLMALHKLESLDKNRFDYYKQLYSPYCSIAAFYLWIAAQN